MHHYTIPYLIFSFGAHAQKKRKFRILKTYDVPAGAERSDLSKIPFSLKEDAFPDALKRYSEAIATAVSKKPTVLLSINRMNYFLTKLNFEDRVLDLTMSLEALIPGKDELRYRFALYLSFVTEGRPENRIEVFELFRALYDTRSRIVHGADQTNQGRRVEAMIKENFSRLQALSLSALNYHLFFLSGNEPASWSDHLQGLVFEKCTQNSRLMQELPWLPLASLTSGCRSFSIRFSA